MLKLEQKIAELKQTKKAAVLAHFYQNKEIQANADFVSDSLEMAKKARDLEAGILVVCGVSFMAETVKMLCPNKKVLLPRPEAGCFLADCATLEKVILLKEKYPQAAFVCYVNSSAEVKALCDICCTSSNAVSIVKGLKEKQVVMLPDGNLALWVQNQVPQKEIIGFNGYCDCHNNITKEDVLKVKNKYPAAVVVAHPEVRKEVAQMADFVGSTAKMVNFIGESSAKEFIIVTEEGILNHLQLGYPEKSFYPVSSGLICASMKMITLNDLYLALLKEQYEVEINADLSRKAQIPLKRMLEEHLV